MSLLGVDVHALTVEEFNRIIADAITAGRRCVIASQNLHSVYLYHHDLRTRQFCAQADYFHIDGMALVILGRFWYSLPLRRDHRVTHADWMDLLMATAAAEGWRVFYLGSRPGVVERGAEILRARHPKLQIQTSHGHFDVSQQGEQNRSVVARIRQYNPHILMVGMGQPRQEHWILDNLPHLTANAIITTGAAMDYIAGVVPTPPRWSGRLGLEWMFRLASEPKRLWRRYLLEPWFIARLLLTESVTSKRLPSMLNSSRSSKGSD